MPEIISRGAAKALGLTRYFTGKACKYGHIAERLVCNHFCSACSIERSQREEHKEYHRKYYYQNPRTPEYRREMAKRFYWRNREKIRIAANTRRANDPEHAHRKRAATRSWRARNRSRVAAYNSAWVASNQAYHAEWRKKNPETLRLSKRASEGKRRHRKNGTAAAVAATRPQIARLLKAATICPDCDRKFSASRRKTIDHVTALAVGGSHAIENLRVICQPCNSSKRDRQFTSNGQGILI